jgi:hypothetical protein
MTEKQIIGIAGFIGSGKDTVADYLVNQYGFERISFAGTLKDIVSVIFGWDRNLLEGRTLESRKWREEIDTWWATRLSIPHLTPRWVLQHWGTDVLRKNFHNDIWIASLENQLKNRSNSIVITDARFVNEHQAIRSQNGIILRVKRGCEPEWYDHAVAVNCLDPNSCDWAFSRRALDLLGIHESETAWAGLPFEYVIENDQTIDVLYKRIDEILFLKCPKIRSLNK